MSAIQVSRLVRLDLEERFSALFNASLSAACDEFAISDQKYSINFAQQGDPTNFYRGNRALEALSTQLEPDLPALTMWIGEIAPHGPGQREMPRTFSGIVYAHWRFFLLVKGYRASGLTDLREATEAAMLATLADEFADITYRGDLASGALAEQIWLDQDQNQVGFVQEVEYQATFEVNV